MGERNRRFEEQIEVLKIQLEKRKSKKDKG
jgi:hypothetical protein